MKNLKEFLNEYRLICSDSWGDAMEAWFECAGQMFKRGLDVPNEWEYRPALGGATDSESYWYDLFENTSDETLLTIGNFLFRYCLLLKRHGKDY
jgi:hypothetical protein